jgi:hypothetical protein
VFASKPPHTTFTVLWRHDDARQLEVVVDADLPAFSPVENRVRGIAAVAKSHATLRLLLQGAFADRWSIGVFEAVGGVTGVHLAPTGVDYMIDGSSDNRR